MIFFVECFCNSLDIELNGCKISADYWPNYPRFVSFIAIILPKYEAFLGIDFSIWFPWIIFVI